MPWSLNRFNVDCLQVLRLLVHKSIFECLTIRKPLPSRHVSAKNPLHVLATSNPCRSSVRNTERATVAESVVSDPRWRALGKDAVVTLTLTNHQHPVLSLISLRKCKGKDVPSDMQHHSAHPRKRRLAYQRVPQPLRFRSQTTAQSWRSQCSTPAYQMHYHNFPNPHSSDPKLQSSTRRHAHNFPFLQPSSPNR